MTVPLILTLSWLPLVVVGLAFAAPHWPLALWATRLAWTTLMVGVGLVAAIAIAGRLADRGLPWLVPVQTWTVRMTFFGVCALIIARAILAALVLSGLAAWVGLTPLSGWAMLSAAPTAAGALLALLALADVVASPNDADPPSTMVALPVTRSAAPALWDVVDDVARELGTAVPAHVVLTYLPTFMALDGVNIVRGPTLSGSTLACSLPLCDLLSVHELRAVMAHELGHSVPEQVQARRRYWDALRHTRDIVRSLEPVEPPGDSAIAFWQQRAERPAQRFFLHVVTVFLPIERRLRRVLELQMDGLGARVASPRVMATALAKMQVYGPVWSPVEVSGFVELVQRHPFDAKAMYRSLVGAFVTSETIDTAMNAAPEPLDSHPTLAARLENLGVPIDQVRAEVLNLSDLVAASRLFPQDDGVAVSLFAAHVRHQYESGALTTASSLAIEPPQPE